MSDPDESRPLLSLGEIKNLDRKKRLQLQKNYSYFWLAVRYRKWLIVWRLLLWTIVATAGVWYLLGRLWGDSLYRVRSACGSARW